MLFESTFFWFEKESVCRLTAKLDGYIHFDLKFNKLQQKQNKSNSKQCSVNLLPPKARQANGNIVFRNHQAG